MVVGSASSKLTMHGGLSPTQTNETERLNQPPLHSPKNKTKTARPRSRSRQSPPRTSPRRTTGGQAPSRSRPCATSTSLCTAARAGPTVRLFRKGEGRRERERKKETG